MSTPLTETAAPSRPGSRTGGARGQAGGVPHVNVPVALPGTPFGYAARRQDRSAPPDRGVVALPAAAPVLGGAPHRHPDDTLAATPPHAGGS